MSLCGAMCISLVYKGMYDAHFYVSCIFGKSFSRRTHNIMWGHFRGGWAMQLFISWSRTKKLTCSLQLAVSPDQSWMGPTLPHHCHLSLPSGAVVIGWTRPRASDLQVSFGAVNRVQDWREKSDRHESIWQQNQFIKPLSQEQLKSRSQLYLWRQKSKQVSKPRRSSNMSTSENVYGVSSIIMITSIYGTSVKGQALR